jgi:two-component system nitrogen regulation sensor histidine kinase GlnL
MTAPSADLLWASVPVPVLVVDGADRIEEANAAAEQFMNQGAKALRGLPVWDKLLVDAPLDGAAGTLAELKLA